MQYGSSRKRQSVAKERARVADRQEIDKEGLFDMAEAASRAGAMVTDQVNAITEAAQRNAAEVERSAEEEADRIRHEASEAASRVLERIDAIESQLGSLVTSLRREADTLTAELERKGRH